MAWFMSEKGVRKSEGTINSVPPRTANKSITKLVVLPFNLLTINKQLMISDATLAWGGSLS